MPNIIYPGTFDPITYGHIDIIRRAARIFDKVIVGIATNSKKKPVLPLNARLKLTQEVLAQYQNVEVTFVKGLLIDFAKTNDCKIILRGLRAVSDFEYEFQLAGMNRSLDNEIETIFLTPSQEYTYISSSLVREIFSLDGDISKFVPQEVISALKNNN